RARSDARGRLRRRHGDKAPVQRDHRPSTQRHQDDARGHGPAVVRLPLRRQRQRDRGRRPARRHAVGRLRLRCARSLDLDDLARGTTPYYLPSERVEDGKLRKRYGTFAERSPDGSLAFYHGDHLGSSTLLTRDGVEIYRAAYYPYGELTDGSQRRDTRPFSSV